ncbi:nitrate- and nitrite sensing domain-containing protein [Microbispora bryophytorum]|uniref:nitrate- and nitrite sensing domain-containing protein n=1 Tax=Microbispora bryophytorum TaxID=1460882 RepID=UPI00143171F3|nr:nitrate- and nitrite sensing domain-containing protein [Microbispora bryophytorum]MBD3137439.1 nitrate- and nitrite sensing domain-containing protein [Microbispora bryophytorum]
MPTRLTALIVAPTIVAVLLGGIRVVGSIDSLTAYQRTRSAAEYSVHLRDLAEQLALERDLFVWGGNSRRAFNVDGETEVTRTQQRAAVDPLIQQVKADLNDLDTDYGTRAVEQAQQLSSRLSSLKGIRENGAPEDYSALIANVLRLQDELGNNDDNPAIVGNVRALNALAHAKEEAALQRATLTRELLERNQTFTTFELQDFLASQSRQQSYLATYYTEAPAAEASRLVTLFGDKDVVNGELTKSWALTLGLHNQSLNRYQGRDRTAQQWFQDSTRAIEQMAAVEGRVSGLVQSRARDLQSAEQRNALIAGGLILALLVLVLVTTVLIARSMVRPLRRLRAEALDIAGRRLPEIVRQMRESEETGRESQVQPIAVDSTDEIGEVAQAFDEVHTQAVRLAAEESRLRTNVNAMFVNLSRRTQTLVERQISLIDGLERGEEDGRRLADLFKLDHLATRMRRNSENLLVLAGHEPPRKRSQPARLVDVVRASLSEVEDYERVVVRIPRTIAIAGHAANDVVHLLAELVENAIAFSPRNTKVVVSSSPVEGGAVMLGVTDAGIGMSPEELVEINRRLAEPPTIDVSVSRRMGLFVVGRLALRHGIRVQLRRGDGAGVIAMVLFPVQLISNADQPVVPRPSVPAEQTAAGLPARQAFAEPDPLAPTPGGGSFEPWNSGNDAAGGGLGARRSSAASGHAPGGNGFGGTGTGGTGTGGFAPFGAPTADAPPTPADHPYGEGAFTEQSGPHSVPGLPGRAPDGDPRRPAFGERSEPSWPSLPTGPTGLPQRGGSPGPSAFSPSDTGSSWDTGSSSDTGSLSDAGSLSDTGPTAFTASPSSTGPTAFSPSNTAPTAFSPSDTGSSSNTGPTAFSPPSTGSSSDTGPTAFMPSLSGTGPAAFAGATPPAGTAGEPGSSAGPLPSVEESPLEQGEEFLPIFASVESAWFRRPSDTGPQSAPSTRTGAEPDAGKAGEKPGESTGEIARVPRSAATSATASATASGPVSAPQAQSGGPGGWRSRADGGFHAAASARDPLLGGVTAAGLPKRTPKANLVPGSVGADGPASAAPRPPVSAEAVRNRLSSFQQGVRRGRAQTAGGFAEGSGQEEEGS